MCIRDRFTATGITILFPKLITNKLGFPLLLGLTGLILAQILLLIFTPSSSQISQKTATLTRTAQTSITYFAIILFTIFISYDTHLAIEASKTSADIIIIVPNDQIAVSNGILVDEEDMGDGRKKYHWSERYPICTYLVSIASYPYTVWYDEYIGINGDTLPLEYYVYPDHYDLVYDNYLLTKDMMEVFADKFGEYPFMGEKYGHADWYDWRWANWGTKWELCEFFGMDLQDPEDSDEATISFSCQSAWSPPLGALEYFDMNTECSVKCSYYEGGMDFMGIWSSDEGDRCWSISEPAPRSDDPWWGTPEGIELDGDFGITETMAHYEEEQENEGARKTRELVVEKKAQNMEEA